MRKLATAALMGVPAFALAVLACLPVWKAGAGLTAQQVDWLVRMPLLWLGGSVAMLALFVAAMPDNRDA